LKNVKTSETLRMTRLLLAQSVRAPLLLAICMLTVCVCVLLKYRRAVMENGM
jgi:hypothetical protein